MEAILKTSAVVSSIIIILVGLIKLPIAKFKTKKWYRPLLTLITLALVIGGSILCEVYILEAPIFAWNTLVLVFAVATEVFVTYNGIYEGLNIKDAIHNLIAKYKDLKALSPEAKAIKKLEKVEDVIKDAYLKNKDTFNIVIGKIKEKADAEEAKNTATTETKTEVK